MSCVLCTYPIAEADSTAETPCCEVEVHTQCLIDTVASNTRHYHDSICVCGGILHAISDNFATEHLATQALNKLKIEDIIKQPAAKQLFTTLKKNVRERGKLLLAFKSKVAEKFREFKEQTAASVALIKTAKTEAIALLKSIDEYKVYTKCISRITYYGSRFKRLYNVNDNEMESCLRGVGVGRRRWRYWSSKPTYIIARKFKMRF